MLKQAKWRALSSAAGATHGLDALDLGSDNGVISWLFRQSGGRWTSGDLTDETVGAIRRMVGPTVHRLHDGHLPCPSASLDLVVVVDLLEHLDDDSLLLGEIARCLRPGGRAVLNVPHLKPAGVLVPLRHALGLTDAWHGHRHKGYTTASLRRMLPRELSLVRARSYSRFFSHLLDTALNWAYLRGTRGHGVATAKGTVVTGTSVNAGGARMLARLYPLMRAFVALDALVPFTRGYMLLAELERRPSAVE